MHRAYSHPSCRLISNLPLSLLALLRLTLTSKTNTEITWGITLVLMFRSVGSILFGIAADRYGRKWPFIVNNVLFIILELVSLSSCFPPLKISFLGKLQHISWGVDR